VHENYEARFHQWHLVDWLRAPAARVFRAMERFFVARLAGVTAVSEGVRAKYEACSRATHLLPNVPETGMFAGIQRVGNPHGPPVVMTSGHNGPDRQCMQTVEALPLILEERPSVIVRFLGRYPDGYREKLWERARILGVEGSLDLRGWLPVAESYQMIANAAVGCVFYEDNPNNRVALGNRIFEYMCCGVPVLAQDFPELRRVVETTGCGVLVDSSNPEDIARGVLEIIQNPESIRELGSNGRQAVEQEYNYKSQLEHLVAFFHQLAGTEPERAQSEVPS
jgi:glycosyltransferase involved in cell wall biosynthesis